MCLAVPTELIKIKDNIGVVETGGNQLEIGLDLIDDPQPGDFLIVHAGFALEKLDIDEAKKRLKLFGELEMSQKRHA
ncbi:MAG: HypC/HybG/HupF family hydrogenase formation chaperone [Vulcanimicrobiota bacterium]